MYCCTLLYVHSSIAIILMGKRELIALLNLSSWCLVMVERLFLAVPRGCLQFVIVVFPDHTHLLFFTYGTFRKVNNKGADQTARMRRLVCVCVVRKPPKTGFLRPRPILLWFHVRPPICQVVVILWVVHLYVEIIHEC